MGGRGVCFPKFPIYLPMNEFCFQTTRFNSTDPIHGSSEVAQRRHPIEGKESPKVTFILVQRYLSSDRRIVEDLVSFGNDVKFHSYFPYLTMFLASPSLLLTLRPRSKIRVLKVRLTF